MATGLVALFPGLPRLQFLITFSTQTGGGDKTRFIEIVFQRGTGSSHQSRKKSEGFTNGCLAGGVWCKGIRYWLLIHNGLWITPAVYCPTFCAGCIATECVQYPYTHTNAKLDTVSFSGHSTSIHPIALHMHTKCCSAHQQWEHLW